MSISGPQEPHTMFLNKAALVLMWVKYSFFLPGPFPIVPRLASNSWSSYPSTDVVLPVTAAFWVGFFFILCLLHMYNNLLSFLPPPPWESLTGTCYVILTLPFPHNYWDYRHAHHLFWIIFLPFPLSSFFLSFQNWGLNLGPLCLIPNPLLEFCETKALEPFGLFVGIFSPNPLVIYAYPYTYTYIIIICKKVWAWI